MSEQPKLLAALQNGKVNKGQDKKLMKLFLEDDDFRQSQIAQLSAGMPQFAFIAELDREDQITIMKKMMTAMSEGDMNAFL